LRRETTIPDESSRDRIAREIAGRISGEVRFDTAARAMYATDASNYRQVPVGVVLPRCAEDIMAAVDSCSRHGLPLTMRGGGTSVAGQTCNNAVVLDASKYYNRVLEIDPDSRTALVEPGCVLDDLRDAAEEHGLTFGPDPSTHDRCSLGGMLGNNSCGVHSVMAGRTADNVEALEVLTYDGARFWTGTTGEQELATIIEEGGRRGEIYAGLRDLRDRYADAVRERYPELPRRVSGYNLPQLLPEHDFHVARALVGTESTCAVILQAKLKLVPSPPARVLLVLGFEDVFAAADRTPEVRDAGPVGLEGMDQFLIDNMRTKCLAIEQLQELPPGSGWLLAEFGGDTPEAAADQARALMAELDEDEVAMKLVTEPAAQRHLWEVRESGLGATAFVPGQSDTWEGWEDSAVPVENLGGYLRGLRRLYDRYGYQGALYGHFGDGCVHTRVDFDLRSEEGIRTWRAFMEDAAELVLAHGGSLSGEHGDGQARAALLVRMYGEELTEAFRQFKYLWDPDGRMNPGKVVDPFPITSNLRLGPDYAPADPQTWFAFADDGGSFARATLRCVGVGKCRDTKDGVMCPSYMATREEQHATRGRARLLFEMLNGDVVSDGWRSREVHDALDLCLACKGCKRDCPVNVDMATYKAEFNAHYYRRRLRPRAAYSLGLVHWWARAAGRAPGLVNAVTRSPGLARIAKAVAGVARERSLPAFRRPFTAGRPTPAARPGGRRVLLFPDTFNNHFRPETAAAAADVLTDAGYEVMLPERPVCCGRPLYAWGMLGLARRQLSRLLDTLAPQLEAGVPVVGLEPACMTTFRDELLNLLPGDPRAEALRDGSFMLSEFLAREGYEPPPLEADALVHAHCNHYAVIGLEDERAMLDAMGLDYEMPDSGCCGMAGSFGLESEHYDVAMRIGERVLLPAVRESAPERLLIADGYACREQVEQSTGRPTLHLAEVMRMAQRGGQ